MVILTAALVLLTAVYVVVAYRQFREMRRQADIADKQTAISAKQASIAEDQAAILARQATSSDEQFGRQLKLAQEAAAAAQQSADAAKKSADALVNSERAWIIIGPKMENFVPNADNNPSFCWFIKNAGRTPARVIETQAVYEKVSSASLRDLPEKPEDLMPIKHNLLLVPNDPHPYTTFLGNPHIGQETISQEDAAKIMGGTLHLRAFGYVKYLDSLGDEHESWFCHEYVRESKHIRGGFWWLLGVPAVYNKHT